MTNAARIIWLSVAVLPYLGLVGVDTWMHEAARKVPRVEQVIHWILAPLLIAFLTSAFLGRTATALSVLAVFIVLLLADELGFHRPLARNERRVHVAAYVALSVFIATWAWMDLRT